MEENNTNKKGNDINKDTRDSDITRRSLEALLKELLNVVPGIKAAAIITIEGLPVISALPEGLNDEKVAATTSTLLSLAERAINEMNVGDLEQLSIQGSISNLIVMAAGQKNVLTILTEKDVNFGWINMEGGRICQRISSLLK